MAKEFKLPPFLNDQDSATIEQRMMDALPADMDKTEAGFAWDFTMPTALEASELLQFYLPEALKIMFPMWAYGAWLDNHAAAYGVSRKPANKATGEVRITCKEAVDLPVGTRVAAPAAAGSPAVVFLTTEAAVIGAGEAALIPVKAEEAGPRGNVAAGTISIMVQPVRGVSEITNPKATIDGSEQESDEALRQRLAEIDEAAEASFVGSDADYIRWAKENAAVGEVFVASKQTDSSIPAGTVQVIILDENGLPFEPQSNIPTEVYNHIVSPDNRIGRKAPVGATVEVVTPALAPELAYTADVILEAGVKAPAAEASFKDRLQEYYKEARQEGMVYLSRVGAVLSETPGIRDYRNLMINGAQQDITLSQMNFPSTKSVTLSVLGGEGQ